MKKIYLHVGYPKTGTTTLQKHFFPKIDEINYMGIYENNRGKCVLGLEVVSDLLFKEPDEIDYSILCAYVDKIMAPHPVSLLSHEEFTALCMKKNPEKDGKLLNHKSIALSLRRAFPPERYSVNIIFTIRRQDEMIPSLYAQAFRHYFSLHKETNTFAKYSKLFFAGEHGSEEFNSPYTIPLDYNKVIADYEAIFSRDSLSVHLFEDLEDEPEHFYRKMCRVLDVDPNKYARVAINQIENKRSVSTGYKKVKPNNLLLVLRKFKKKYIGSTKFRFIPGFVKDALEQIQFFDRVSKTVRFDGVEGLKVLAKYRSGNLLLSDRYALGLEKKWYKSND